MAYKYYIEDDVHKMEVYRARDGEMLVNFETDAGGCIVLSLEPELFRIDDSGDSVTVECENAEGN